MSDLDFWEKRVAELEEECTKKNEKIDMLELKLKTKDNLLKINLNHTIKVKLTPLGEEIYYKKSDELNKNAWKIVLEPRMPQIDKDGYTKFQLWHFIELYGKYIGMCKPNVIEPIEIIICY